MFRKGQVVLTECNWSNLFSRWISASEQSPITHAWIVTDKNRGVEATFPRVRPFNIDEKIAHLQANDQAFIVLDLPRIGLLSRVKVAQQAESYIGRYYDVGQALLYAATHKFWNDGTGTLLCSRLITASYLNGAKLDLFPERVLELSFPPDSPRLDNLRSGYATPADLLRSRLEVVGFSPSSRFSRVEDFFPPSK